MSSDLVKQEVKTEFEEADNFDSVEEIDLVMGPFISYIRVSRSSSENFQNFGFL